MTDAIQLPNQKNEPYSTYLTPYNDQEYFSVLRRPKHLIIASQDPQEHRATIIVKTRNSVQGKSQSLDFNLKEQQILLKHNHLKINMLIQRTPIM